MKIGLTGTMSCGKSTLDKELFFAWAIKQFKH